MKMIKIKWQYTLGEISIVIIGISIAFSLSNWNENRKNNIKKTEYLKNLKLDIENEKTQFENNIVSYNEYSAKATKLIPHLGRELPGRDSISGYLFELATVINFIPQTVSYNTMINSGDYI